MQTPELTFESERLLYRPLVAEDIDLSLELWTDPDITRFVGGARSEAELIEGHPLYMRRCALGCIGIWTLAIRESDEKIGTAILLPMPVEEDDTNWDMVAGEGLPDCEIEVGYILKKSAWGKGYATEACKRLIQFGFEATELEEIVASTDVDNSASQSVLLKSGMRSEGLRKSYAIMCPGFRITRTQWCQQQAG